MGGGEERKSDISFSPKHFIFQRLKYTEQMNPFPVLHSPPRSNSHCRFLVTKFFPILTLVELKERLVLSQSWQDSERWQH